MTYEKLDLLAEQLLRLDYILADTRFGSNKKKALIIDEVTKIRQTIRKEQFILRNDNRPG